MARFSFHAHDGVDQIDTLGTELRTWEHARAEAVRLAGSILHSVSKRGALGEDWHMEVTEEAGLILFRLDLTVVEAPVVRELWQSGREAEGD